MSWDELEDAPEETKSEARRLAGLCAQTFGSGAGAEVLAHLRRITIETQTAPACPEATLRDLEGQRRLVRYIEAMVRKGQTGE